MLLLNTSLNISYWIVPWYNSKKKILVYSRWNQ